MNSDSHNKINIPVPPDLDHAPELAVMAVLQAALRAAQFAVIAVHPPMRGDDLPSKSVPDSYWVASVFVTFADHLDEAITAYQRVVVPEQAETPTSSDFPF